MTIRFECQQCGARVVSKRSPANMKSAPRFCSQKCHGDHRRGSGKGIAPNCDVTCEHCGKIARVYRGASAQKPRFCSLTCLGFAQRGEANPAFSGGRHMLKTGYMVVLAPDDPEADSRGYVLEHRMVIRRAIGRMLLPGEVVHHKDGDKTNNNPVNLFVFTSQAEHARHHAREVTA